MARLGVETARWAFYTINKATFAKYSERDSPRIPWVHVGRSSRVRAPCEGRAGPVYRTVVGKGLTTAAPVESRCAVASVRGLTTLRRTGSQGILIDGGVTSLNLYPCWLTQKMSAWLS